MPGLKFCFFDEDERHVNLLQNCNGDTIFSCLLCNRISGTLGIIPHAPDCIYNPPFRRYCDYHYPADLIVKTKMCSLQDERYSHDQRDFLSEYLQGHDNCCSICKTQSDLLGVIRHASHCIYNTSHYCRNSNKFDHFNRQTHQNRNVNNLQQPRRVNHRTRRRPPG